MKAAWPLPGIAAVVFALMFAAPAAAQPSFFERLLGGRLGSVQTGSYLAGDKIKFEIDRVGHDFLLRFDNNPETFVLYPDRTSLGGRVLKYDSGETAIRVAGWGALTLYTDAKPDGIPAMRDGEASQFSPIPVSVQDVQFIAVQDAARLRRTRHLRIAFTINWSVLETDADLRATASNALENTARGIERFVHDARARKQIAARIATVTLATGRLPTLKLQDKTLIVTFNPERGYTGSASSRAVAHALSTLLGGKQKPVHDDAD
jgi:hypothetical protein